MKTTLKDKAFEVYLSVVLTAGVSVLAFVYSNISDLNQKMAIIVEKVSQHDGMINNSTTQVELLERRIRAIEIQNQILIDRTNEHRNR